MFGFNARKLLSTAGMAAAVLSGLAGTTASASDSAFTYQGVLTSAGLPVGSSVEVSFRLFDAAAGGTQVGATITRVVAPVGGRFTESLNFGEAAFVPNQPLWLEIEVEGDLLGRQALDASPFALNTRGVVVDSNDFVGLGDVYSQGDTIPFKLSVRDADAGIFVQSDPGSNASMHWMSDSSFLSTIYAPTGSNDLRVAHEGSGDVVAITNSGRVGIGTNSPSHLLDVRGSLRIGDGVTNSQDIDFFSQDGAWQVGTNSPVGGGGVDSNIFYIYDTSTANYALTVTKGDNHVGIGTTSPERSLHVRSTTGQGTAVRIDGAGPAGISLRSYPDATFDSPSNGWDIREEANGQLSFVTRAGNGVEQGVSFHGGIGPLVYGEGSSPWIEVGRADGTTGLAMRIGVQRSLGTAIVGYAFEPGGGAGQSEPGYPHQIVFDQPGIRLQPYGVEWGMLYTTGGQLGIGVQAPQRTLDVNGDAEFAGPVRVSRSNGNAVLQIANEGLGAPSRLQFLAFQNTLAWELATDTEQFNDLQLTNKFIGGFPVIEVDADTSHIGINGFAPADYTVAVNGNVCATAFLCASSRALKDNIAAIDDALGLVDRLEGVTYTWNESASEEVRGQHAIGFIAEDVGQVLPTLVATDDEGNAISIDYAKMTPVAIQAIKELKAQHGEAIDELKCENDELRVRLERLELMLNTYAQSTD